MRPWLRAWMGCVLLVCGAAAAADDHVDRAVDDPVRPSRDGAQGRAGDPRAAQGRRGVHELRRRGRRPGPGLSEGRGFLAPPEALDALKALGFNLLALSNNHAFDLQGPGIATRFAKSSAADIAHAGVGNDPGRGRGAGLPEDVEGHRRTGRERLRPHRVRRHGDGR